MWRSQRLWLCRSLRWGALSALQRKYGRMFQRDEGVASPGRRTKTHPVRCVKDEDTASGVICPLKRQRICVGGH